MIRSRGRLAAWIVRFYRSRLRIRHIRPKPLNWLERSTDERDIMLMPHRPMSSTERVRNFRARHGLSRSNVIGAVTFSGMRPPAAPARRARKLRTTMELPVETPAEPSMPLALPAPVETIEIPGMSTVPAIRAVA